MGLKNGLIKRDGSFIYKNEYNVLQEFNIDPAYQISESYHIEEIHILWSTIEKIRDKGKKFCLEIPESIGTLIYLKKLSLYKIKNLPKSMQKLINLQYFSYSNKNLTEIPKWIGKLKNLKRLHISNQIKTIPESIGNLRNLIHLELNNNKITNLPESIGNLQNLEILRLKNNNLKSFPESIGNLRNLKELILENNKIESLPDSLFKLKNLVRLNLNNNQLKKISDKLGNLKNLGLLELSSNDIYNLPESIGRLKNFEYLNISKNEHFENLPSSFINLKDVGGINIRNTSVHNLSNINFFIEDFDPNVFTQLEYDFNNYWVTDKGYNLYYRHKFDELMEYYKKTTMELALQLANNDNPNNPDILTNDEKERLIHEASWREREILERVLDYDHPILHEINEAPRFKIKMKNGQILRK